MSREMFHNALSAMNHVYQEHVESLGRDFKARIKAKEFEDRESFLEALHEKIDSDEWVIYTTKAQAVALCSNNSGAIDDLGTDSMVKDGSINWGAIAYCALEADVLEWLSRSDVDVNDDDTFTSDEDEEDEEGDES